jgi:hypothetical protein
VKAFRGSTAEINSPAANFAVTSDVAPFDTVALPAVAANYGADGAEVHSSLRIALLGDGTSPTSVSADGVYLVSLQISSTQAALTSSDPFYFVLNKNAAWSTVVAAVNSLGVASSRQQWVVPEPECSLVACTFVAGLITVRGRTRGKR